MHVLGKQERQPQMNAGRDSDEEMYAFVAWPRSIFNDRLRRMMYAEEVPTYRIDLFMLELMSVSMPLITKSLKRRVYCGDQCDKRDPLNRYRKY